MQNREEADRAPSSSTKSTYRSSGKTRGTQGASSETRHALVATALAGLGTTCLVISLTRLPSTAYLWMGASLALAAAGMLALLLGRHSSWMRLVVFSASSLLNVFMPSVHDYFEARRDPLQHHSVEIASLRNVLAGSSYAYFTPEKTFSPEVLQRIDAAEYSGLLREHLFEMGMTPLGTAEMTMTLFNHTDTTLEMTDVRLISHCEESKDGSVFTMYTQGGGGDLGRASMYFDLALAEPYPQATTFVDNMHVEPLDQNFFTFSTAIIDPGGTLPLVILLDPKGQYCSVSAAARIEAAGQHTREYTLFESVSVAGIQTFTSDGSPVDSLQRYWNGPLDTRSQVFPGWRLEGSSGVAG